MNLQALLPTTSSWYQCSFQAQLVLIWVNALYSHALAIAAQYPFCTGKSKRRKSLLLLLSHKLPASPFLAATTHHYCSSLVSPWVTFFILCGLGLTSANTLWQPCHCVSPAHLPPQLATQCLKHSTCPASQPLSQADMAQELPPALGLDAGILFLESNTVRSEKLQEEIRWSTEEKLPKRNPTNIEIFFLVV